MLHAERPLLDVGIYGVDRLRMEEAGEIGTRNCWRQGRDKVVGIQPAGVVGFHPGIVDGAVVFVDRSLIVEDAITAADHCFVAREWTQREADSRRKGFFGRALVAVLIERTAVP